jgi:long-chain-acyl-CoA dehydrogenase
MALARTLFTAEHEAFRDTCRAFIDKHVVPHNAEWAAAGQVDRELWREAGRHGLLGMAAAERYGGGGVDDFRFNVVLDEELTRGAASGVGFAVHNDLILPYLERLATDEQKQRWLPGFCSGELITAIAMTEPGAGSDLQAIRTTAIRDGDSYLLNGQKTFISNGILADLVLVAVKTDPTKGAEGLSIIVVERGTPGFERGRNLDKIGMKAQDTAELFFTDARVPAANLLGEEGDGFRIAQERLGPGRIHHAMRAIGMAERALEMMCQRTASRTAFGQPIIEQGVVQQWISRARIWIEQVRLLVLKTAWLMDTAGNRGARIEVSAIKVAAPEMATWVIDRAIQAHGGAGVSQDFVLAELYAAARAMRIFDGPDEVHHRAIARRETRRYR